MPKDVSLSHRDLRRKRDNEGFAAALQYAGELAGAAGGGNVLIPPGDFIALDDVFIDPDAVEVIGAGKNDTFLTFGGCASLHFGLPRAPGGATLGTGHWVDLYGKLDTSAAATPGVRWGLRTVDSVAGTYGHPTFTSSPLQFGKIVAGRPDFWARTRQLAIDFALDAPGGALPDGPIMGAIDAVAAPYRPAPFYCWYAAPDLWTRFATIDGDGTVTERLIRLPGPTITNGVQRITIALDLLNAQVYLAWNRVQFAADLAQIGSNWSADVGLGFAGNRFSPFNLGTISGRAAGWGGDTAVTNVSRLDRTFCGLRLTDGVPYADDGAGQPQRRLDGQTLNDYGQFFRREADAGTFAILPLNDPPGSQRVTVFPGLAGGEAATRGLFLTEQHGDLISTIRQRNALRNMTVQSNYYWTAPVTLGTVWRFELTDVNAFGGCRGVDQHILGVSYPVLVRDCEFQGSDAGYFGFAQELRMDSVYFNYPGRTLLRLLACTAIIRTIKSGGDPAANLEYGIALHQGVNAVIEDVSLDFEADVASPTAFLLADAFGVVNNDTLVLRDAVLGILGRKASVVHLTSTGYAYAGGNCTIERVALQDPNVRSFVRNSAPGRTWITRVRDGQPRRGTAVSELTWVEYDDPTAVGSVRVERDDLDLPPRRGTWARNSFVFRVPDPLPGQYAAWIGPHQGGTCGTAEPPQWTGIDPVGTGLAGYALGRSYALHQPVVAAFSPADIPGLQCWLAADRIAGLADGADVATWPDQSGQGHDATQAQSWRLPTYLASAVNGLPAVRANPAENDELVTPALPIGTVFAVARYQDPGNWPGFRNLLGMAGGGRIFETDPESTRLYLGNYPGETRVNGVVTSECAPIDAWKVLTATRFAAVQNDGLDLFANHSDGTYGKFDLAELIVYESALSDADRVVVETYLKGKYGIT